MFNRIFCIIYTNWVRKEKLERWVLLTFSRTVMKTFYIYSELELESGSGQVDAQHFPRQHLITNPNAIKGSPKLLKQPQHVLHATAVQVLPIKARLNKYEPNTKQTKSQATAK